MTVLIVDDAMFIRKMLKDIFIENGFTIIGEAENGSKAIELCRKTPPDIITMDITMPEMDGVQAVKEIRRFNKQSHIIMCSAMGQKWMVIEALNAGANDFIVKPFNKKHIEERIKSLK